MWNLAELNYKAFKIGDLNYDLTLDVIDIVLLIDLVIIFSQNGDITAQELQIADIYNDGQLNIIDIVGGTGEHSEECGFSFKCVYGNNSCSPVW